MRSHMFSVLSAAAMSIFTALAAGCAAESTSSDPNTTTEGQALGHEHLMLTDQARAALDPVGEKLANARGISGSKLTYYGGPVIQNVHVVPVYWNSSVANQTSINAFYSALTTGQYMTFLSQYSTSSPKQTIGNGSRGTPYVDNQTATNVTDAQVQTELNRLFAAGALPAPNNNNLYMVHFPAGVTITDSSGNQSCVYFCAYHGTYVRNGQNVYYGIMPDLSGAGCNGGCGTSTVFNNTTSVASHEFAESVTDPAVGLATVYGPPLGWYNSSKGEIGDICNGQQTSATLGDGRAYTVQKLVNNATGTCVSP